MKAILLALAALTLHAQIQTINSTDDVRTGPTKLNDNFSYLDTYKVGINRANTYQAFLQRFDAALMRMPERIVSGLPAAASSTNQVFVVTNGTSASDCTVGGGSTRALCISNGSAWVALGGGNLGTVTSVGLLGTTNQLVVTGSSPITSAGTFTISFASNVTLPGTTTGTFSGNLTGDVTGSASLNLLKSSNLSDLANTGTARTNLGLTALATTAPGSGVVAALGNTADGAGGFCLVGGSGCPGGGASTSQQLTDLKLTRNSGTQLTVASGVYGSNTETFSYAGTVITRTQLAISAATGANPMVVTVSAVPSSVQIGDTLSIAGAAGTGCSGMNASQTVTDKSSTTVTFSYNNTGCTYTASSATLGSNSSATGTVVVYGDSTGVVQVQHPSAAGLILTCTGDCQASQEDTPAVPADGFQISEIPLTGTSGGTFDTGVVDTRAAFNASGVQAGFGITVTPAGGISTVSANTAIVPDKTGSNTWVGSNDFTNGTLTPPGSNTLPATCTAGQVYVDRDATTTGQFNVCTSTNTWTTQGGGGATPGTGGADFFWGAPAYTMSGLGNVVNAAGFAHGGISFTFYARVQTISKITYKVTAAAASGSGMIVGIYTANQSSAVCSAVASGTSVTTTGFKSLSISGCTGLVIGQPYTIILSSDDTTLALESYGDAYSFGFQNEGASAGVCGTTTACRAGYDATTTAGVVSTGTGAGLTFNTLSAVSWTSLPDATATFRLVLGFVN